VTSFEGETAKPVPEEPAEKQGVATVAMARRATAHCNEFIV
jgi:hypothetical protein